MEGWNKHVRPFQNGPCARARQISVKKNIHEIFRCMLIVSNSHVQDRREGGSQGNYKGAQGLKGPVRNKVCNFVFIVVSFRGRFQARGPTKFKV